jgi:arsenite-transporting ATPase
MAPRLWFHIGKGGVGKSTTAALTSVYLARSGLRTLLISMDPAHNQRDIFRQTFAEKPQSMTENLMIKEVSVESWTRRYLRETQSHIRQTYTYHSAFNLGGYFKVMKYSPGLEEYALLMAFEDTVRQYADDDAVLVFDMPPTALTMKFFSLPSITLVWLKELLDLRQKINDRKAIISKIKIGRKEIERDRVLTRLDSMMAAYQRLQAIFQSDRAHIHLVLNNDTLSVAEGRRIQEKLADIDLSPRRILVNRLHNGSIPSEIQQAATSSLSVVIDRHGRLEGPLRLYPSMPAGLRGIDSLFPKSMMLSG